MVSLRVGKNRVRDLVNTDISSVEHGTDGTAPTVSDTGLGVAVAATNSVPIITSGTQLLNVTDIILSTVAAGTTFKEKVIFMNSDAVALDRVVYPDYDHNASQELHSTTVFRVD
jgi:hypothetical protein